MIRCLNESIPGLPGLVALASALNASAQPLPPRVPPGFVVEKVAGEAQVSFPMFACFDDRGRLYVTESSGGDLYAELVDQVRKCRIRRLEDKDGDGRYETATVFADGLVPSMGIAWRDGKIYAADPPDLAVYEDTNDDGKSDRRTVLLTGFGHTDNGSLHGLVFGPDGRLYMTTGHPDGYRIVTKEGPVLEGRSGALFRCRPDGTGLEVIARGFENLVEVAFTPSGEILGTDNWFQRPEGGIRDAIVHLVDGGLYPDHPDSGTPQPVTGDPLPAASLYPAVALSGLDIAEGAVFPEAIRGRLLSAQHNTRKVQSHVLHREGSTYRITDEEFVASDDPDFHPSDVLACPDGSVLVVDTGSWYVHHCPTGKIRESPARGGIWRVQAVNASDVKRRGESATRPGRPSQGDSQSRPYDLHHVDASVRRAAADSLARSGGPGDLPVVWEALTRDPIDRFLEHALIHAAHKLAGADAGLLEKALAHPHPRVRRAALLLLNQPPRPGLSPESVVERLKDADPAVRRAAMTVFRSHPGWSKHAVAIFDLILLTGPDPDALRDLVLAFQADPGMQEKIGRSLLGGLNLAKESQRKSDIINPPGALPHVEAVKHWADDQVELLVDILSRTRLPDLPGTWREGIHLALRHPELSVRLTAVRAASRIGGKEFDENLAQIADAPENERLRLESFRAIVARHPRPSELSFEFLVGLLARKDDPASRLSAAEALGRCRLTDAQILFALDAVGNDPLIPPAAIFATYVESSSPESAERLVARMETEAGAGRWIPSDEEMKRIAARLPEPLRPRAAEIRSPDGTGTLDASRKRLTDAEPLLAGGDPAKGRAVFFGTKVACSGCHRIGAEGGRVGPDLTRIGAVRSGRDLLESILFPSSTFAQGFDPYVVETEDETVVSGVVEDLFSDPLILRGPGGAETRVPRSAIKSLRKGSTSIMPEGLDRALTEAEFRDLLAFLQGS